MIKKHYLPDGYIPTAEEANRYIVRPYGSIEIIGNKHEETMEKGTAPRLYNTDDDN